VNVHELVYRHSVVSPHQQGFAERLTFGCQRIKKGARCGLNVVRKTICLGILDNFWKILQHKSSLQIGVVLVNAFERLTSTATHVDNGDSVLAARVELEGSIKGEGAGAMANLAGAHARVPRLETLRVGLQVLHVAEVGGEAQLKGTTHIVTHGLPLLLLAKVRDSEDGMAGEVIDLSCQLAVVSLEVDP
jgi:hypothetical protein